MSKPYILICDDEARRELGWRDGLREVEPVQSAYEIRTARIEGAGSADGEAPSDTPSPLTEIVTALERRRLRARDDDRNTEEDYDDDAAVLDATAVLVVDYDLLMLGEEEVSNPGTDGGERRTISVSHLTGERIAYLARCYSRCGVVVAMNQFANDVPSFDLNLTGHARSFADINIASGELDNPGLWAADPAIWPEYRPWRWPALLQAVEAFEARIQELLDGALDEPVVRHLGFPEAVVDAMPRGMLDFLSVGDDVDISDVTFRRIATDSDVGFKRKDRPLDEQGIARVAAARVSHWLEHLVLPAQDVLVDAPHLALRYPSVLPRSDGKPEEEEWNATTKLTDYDSLPIQDGAFGGARFPRPHWVSRPTWLWDVVSRTDAIPEVSAPWKAEHPPLVFAEDTSRFIAPEEARSFVADVTSPYARRFVAKIDGVEYRPAVRFSM